MTDYAVALELEIAALRGRLDGLELARSLYVGNHRERHIPAGRSSRAPSSWRISIFDILAQHPQGLTSRQINDALAHRPGVNPKTINSLLSVATTRGSLSRDETGRYSIPTFVDSDGREVCPTTEGVRQLAEFH